MVSIIQGKSRQIQADAYKLIFPEDDRPFLYVESADGERLADLFAYTSVHTTAGPDDTTEVGEWQIVEHADEVVCQMVLKSSVWDEKTIRFRCQPDSLVYEVEVTGKGHLLDVNYFGGYSSESLRWGSGFFWSGMKALQGFNPEPNCDEIFYFDPDSTSVIHMTGVPIPGRGDWFFTPPPFCFSFESKIGWFSLGIEAAPGENRFTEYRYQGQQFGFYLAISYEGYTQVDGRYQLPAIRFQFADNEYQALEGHVTALHKNHLAPNPIDKLVPSWWRRPIFCGWGAQCYVAEREKGHSADYGHAPSYSRQALYQEWMETLDARQIRPGIVVLDDKWQVHYGLNDVDVEKWPDLPGFAKFLHDRGQKMLLWLKAWDPEGVADEECVLNAAGHKVSIDPTNPAYQARLRESVRRMLSEDGYNADGFKIDFSARIPSGPGFRKYGDVWGLELMKLYLSVIYDEAKRVKPDALVMAHTPHPYLADVLDMIRLNDVNVATDINKAMIHRARVAAIACPSAVIDTDNWPMPNKEAWRQYVVIQPELGVPSLYFASHVDATQEPLDEQDYQLIRDAWRRYQSSSSN
ncbi:hypothetical protein [Alicyclobacillus acidiphilus]|uniref:hypothetical protein n=1 Tax=Alicyclobacillus acidiphilus TaxID=182455 RepID=UPI00082CF933|nr:hypothetical protein [Alicyclobacillus acidiphilus]